MKKLSLYVFLVLMICNVGFAEMYACSMGLERYNRAGEIETSIFERKGNFFFDDLNIKYRITAETNKEIFLTSENLVGDGLYIVIINKKTKEYTYTYLYMDHARENESYPIPYGKCIIK